MTGGDFRSMIFPTQYRVPSYAHWLVHVAPGQALAALNPRPDVPSVIRKLPAPRQAAPPAPRWC